MALLNSFQTITGKFSVMTGTLLYVVGSRERQSKITEEMHIPLRPIPKEDSIDRSEVLDTWKVTQLNLSRQDSGKYGSA